MEKNTMPYKLNLEFEFPSEKAAKIALNTLLPEEELRPDQISKTLSVYAKAENTEHISNLYYLKATFTANSENSLRTVANAFMDSLGIVIQTMRELSPEYLQKNDSLCVDTL